MPVIGDKQELAFFAAPSIHCVPLGVILDHLFYGRGLAEMRAIQVIGCASGKVVRLPVLAVGSDPDILAGHRRGGEVKGITAGVGIISARHIF
jgi:hypothetical protein